MRWPWTSVARLDDLKDSHDWTKANLVWAHERVAFLEEQIVRMERTDRGMPEMPHKPRQIRNEPMPADFEEYFSGFMTRQLAAEARRAVRTRYLRGEEYDTIRATLMDGAEDPAA